MMSEPAHSHDRVLVRRQMDVTFIGNVLQTTCLDTFSFTLTCTQMFDFLIVFLLLPRD